MFEERARPCRARRQCVRSLAKTSTEQRRTPIVSQRQRACEPVNVWVRRRPLHSVWWHTRLCVIVCEH
eukprot:2873157-Alexandrium_andersonii.AAC.1